MHLFYTPDIIGETYTFNEEESKHCVRVLRMQEGDEIQLTDGKGFFYTASIIDAHPKHCSLRITDKAQQTPLNYYLHLAVAPTKNMERIEWLVEKATEIGWSEFTPLMCRFSERDVIKSDRIEKVLVSAIKQSLQAYFPKHHPLQPFSKFIQANKDFKGQKMIAHCHDLPKKNLKEVYEKSSPVLILIGPEGDFSVEEVHEAVALGFVPISLSGQRLRTETAALVACHSIAFINQ